MLSRSFVGSPETVRDGLERFTAETAADEIIVAAAIHDHGARLRSYELLGSCCAVTRFAVLAIGEAMVDVARTTPPAPSPAHGRIELRAGGTPVNAALAARSAGAAAAVIAAVGDDAAAAVIRSTLEAAGAAALLSVEPGRRTGVFVEVDGAIVADRGANDHLSVSTLPEHDALLVSGYTFREATAATAARRSH